MIPLQSPVSAQHHRPLPARSPKSRKSLSLASVIQKENQPQSRPLAPKKRVGNSLGGPTDVSNPILLPLSLAGLKPVASDSPKKVAETSVLPRAAENVDEIANSPAKIKGPVFSLGQNTEVAEISPRRKARRSMVPRKSILKPQVNVEEEHEDANDDKESDDEDEDQTSSFPPRNYAHTIAFSSQTKKDVTTTFDRKGRPSLGRRVSFASTAHIRMFETVPQRRESFIATLPPANTGPRQSGAHARRSSIQNLAALAAQANAQNNQDGEESMEIEEDQVDAAGVQRFEGQQQQQFVFGVTPPDDEEVDMEESRVYGGVVYTNNHNGQDPDDTEEEGDDSNAGNDTANTADDEEKTMDFTIAVGGLIPPAPPEGAYSDRNSIGYTVPGQLDSDRLHPGEGDEGEVDEETSMEVTTAFGGIIGDDSLSSAGEDNLDRERTMTFSFGNIGADTSGMDLTIAGGGIMAFSQAAAQQEEDDGMDMTIATGGIVSFSHHQQQLQLNNSAAPHTHMSPFKRINSSTVSNTHPTPGTPSFARPTSSSTQKAKRNIFAPSPSPIKDGSATTTPRSKAAEDVAKRLSFGSTASSGGGKRPRTDDVTGGSSNKKRAIEGVFGSASLPRKSNSPSKSSTMRSPKPMVSSAFTPSSSRKGTPRKIGFPIATGTSYSSSSSSSSLLDNNGNERMGGDEDWEQAPTISLADFLEMTGVTFIEGLQGLTRRRSMAKGVLTTGDREFKLHEYAEGQIHSVFLNMYDWASKELLKDIKSGQQELVETESLSSLHNPPVIKEYLSASDEDKLLFEMTFKAFKTNTQLKARERWYDWKMGVMEKIRPDVEEMLDGMREDDDHLTQLSSLTATLLPDLRERLASLQAELVKEREVVAEIAACDEEQLALYKADVSEQAAQIRNFSSELEESSTKLEALTSKLDELINKKTECQSAILTARSKCDQFTKSDIARLKEEYDSIQHLHLWHTTSVTPHRLEMVYSDEIKLSFTSQNYTVNVNSAVLELVPRVHAKGGLAKDFGQGMLEVLQSGMAEILKLKSLSTIVQKIGKSWSSTQRLRAELNLLQTRFPVRYSTSPKGLEANVHLVLPSVRSKVVCSFTLGWGVMRSFPRDWEDVDVNVLVMYGSADVERLVNVAKGVMASATAEGYSGIFLQSCVEAAAQY